MPAGCKKARSYETRGWFALMAARTLYCLLCVPPLLTVTCTPVLSPRRTMFERCSAELAKSFKLQKAKWKLVIDIADKGGGAQRRLPTTPERFAKLLDSCQFTNGSDLQTVLDLYKQTAVTVLGTVEELDYRGLPIICGDAWCSPVQLGGALNYCRQLKKLVALGNRLDDAAVFELVDTLENGALPLLEYVDLGTNRIGPAGVSALFNIFLRGVAPKLTYLSFYSGGGSFGDAGAEAVATALATGHTPPELCVDMMGCDVGDKGANALAAALPEAGPGCRVTLFCCRLSLSAQSTLLAAIEAKHGPSLANSYSVLLNGPLFGQYNTRFYDTGARGFRLASESGRIMATG